MMCHILTGSIRCGVNCAEQPLNAVAVKSSAGCTWEDWPEKGGLEQSFHG